MRKHEDWEDSVEGIDYELKTWGDATSDDEEDKIIIINTLRRLPKKVRGRGSRTLRLSSRRRRTPVKTLELLKRLFSGGKGTHWTSVPFRPCYPISGAGRVI